MAWTFINALDIQNSKWRKNLRNMYSPVVHCWHTLHRGSLDIPFQRDQGNQELKQKNYFEKVVRKE